MKSCVLIFCMILLQTISSENVKETLKESDIENYYKNELGHERYARHVQTVTESVIDHLLKEVKKRYYSNKEFSSNQLSKIAQKISNKMKHLRKEKLKKEKGSKLKKSKKRRNNKNAKRSKTAQHSKNKMSRKTSNSSSHVKPKRSKKKDHGSKKKPQNNAHEFTPDTEYNGIPVLLQ